MPAEIFRSAFNEPVNRLLKSWGPSAGVLGVVLGLIAKIAPSPAQAGGWAGVFDAFDKATGGQTMTPAPGSWINLTGFGLSIPLLLGLFAIQAGSLLTAGEEEKGRLALLMSYPVPRRQMLLEKFAALTAGTLLLGTALFAALACTSLAAGTGLQTSGLAMGCLNTTLLGLTFGAAAFAVGASTGSTLKSWWVPMSAGLVLGLLFWLPGLAAENVVVRGIAALSRFTAHPGADGLLIGRPLVWVVASAVLLATGTSVFEKRDLEV